MKMKWKALGKAAAYALLFLGAQAIAGMGIMVCVMLSYLYQYPILVEMDPEQALDLVMDMSAASMPTYMLVGILIANFLSLLMVLLFFWIRKKNFFREVQLVKPQGRHLLLAAVIGLTFFCVTVLLDSVMPYSDAQWQELEENAGMLPDGISLLTMLAVAAAAPVVEEIFFRGLVYTRLRRGFGMVVSMLLSAAMFGLGHGGTIWFVSSALAGLVLAFALEQTGSLYIPILIHLLNNTVAQMLQTVAELPDWVIFAGAAVCLGAVFLLWKTGRREDQTPAVHDKTDF